jgi:hypothetical protein
MKLTKQKNSQDMIASAERIDRLGSKRFATDTTDQRLNALNARLNKVCEFMEELALDLLDNDNKRSYGGSLKKLNAVEAARLQSEINEECGVEVQ